MPLLAAIPKDTSLGISLPARQYHAPSHLDLNAL